jgi:heat shock protein HslJ
MKKLFVVLALPMLMAISAGSVRASDAVERILAEARNECKSFENGVLTIDMDRAVTEIDVTGNGKMDKIIDSAAFDCSSAHSWFCGTGGCGLDVIAEGTTFNFLAKAWAVQVGNNPPELAIAVHWSECHFTSFCFEKYVWTGAAFESLGANVEDPSMIMGLFDGPWVLQDFGDGKVTVEFGADGSLSGQGPCNKYRASHEVTYPDITIGPILSTRMACGNSDEEFRYFDQMAKVRQIRLAQGLLVLVQEDGAKLTFKR